MSLVATMCEKPMVSHPYAKTLAPPKNHREQKCMPTEEEESDHRIDVKRNHDECGDPNDGLRKCSAVREDAWHVHTPLLI